MRIKYKRPLLYPKQAAFVDCKKRYVIVEASTKSGKTVGCVVWIFEEALQGEDGDHCWWVAPTTGVAGIAFRRLKRFLHRSEGLFEYNESNLTIKLWNGVTIWFKSGDKPDTLYGEDVIAAVIDEATRCKQEVFTAVRSTLTATGGKCRIIGNVKGKTNWMYKMARKAESGELKNWQYFRITAVDAAEAGVFPMSEIEDARQSLTEWDFQELYMAIAFDHRGKPFVWAYSDENNLDNAFKFDRTLPIYLSFDFNVDPITAIACQHDPGGAWIRIGMEFRIRDSNIYELCDQIRATFGEHDFVVNGDPAGKSRSAMVKDNLNYYKIIQKELRIPTHAFKIASKAPGIRNSRVLTNALFARHPDCRVSHRCEYVRNDLKYVQTAEDGTIDKSSGELTHLLDCVRYYFWANFSTFVKRYG